MKSHRTFSFTPKGETLELSLSSAELGFEPLSIWNPSPSASHRTAPYPVPQVLPIGIRVTEITSAKFSPPPIAVVLESGEGRWFLGVAAEAGWHCWSESIFEATAEGIRVTVDLEGQTDPALAAGRIRGLLMEFDKETPFFEVLARGLALQYPPPPVRPVPEWWLRPIYCGWGDQVAHAMHQEGIGRECRALAYCIQGLYERWIARIEEASLPVGTVTIDAGWSPSGVWEPDPLKWPDLRGFIQRQHAAGRKVLLWLGTWLLDGLPKELSILGDGRQWTADPSNPLYLEKVTRWVTDLLGPDGFDADGFKIDQLGCYPNRRAPQWMPRFGTLEEWPPVQTICQAGKE